MFYVVVHDSGARKELEIPAGRVVSMGRSSSSDLQLAALGASRNHVQIRRTGARLEVRDRGARNGTWLSRRAAPGAEPLPAVCVGGDWTRLLPGDRVALAPDCYFVVHEAESSAGPGRARRTTTARAAARLSDADRRETVDVDGPRTGALLDLMVLARDLLHGPPSPPQAWSAALAALRDGLAGVDVLAVASPGRGAGTPRLLASAGAGPGGVGAPQREAAALAVLAGAGQDAGREGRPGEVVVDGADAGLVVACGGGCALVATVAPGGAPLSRETVALLRTAAVVLGHAADRAWSGGEPAHAEGWVRPLPAAGGEGADVDPAVLDLFGGPVASTAMRDVLLEVGRVAPSRHPVLLLGESGVGKELVARFVHDAGDRRERPFVAVNVTALSPSLVESELFGHVEGAFSGAVASRQGLFARAAGGTLFLDEIGDLAPEVQVKLLRALQESVVTPVGADAETRVDVRIVAATHQDLSARMESGGFRRDLYFRLAAFPFRVPPLRERLEDILPLARRFLARAHPDKVLDRDAAARLVEHAWPGNVRELDWVMTRAASRSPDRFVRTEHLGLDPASDPGAAGDGPLAWADAWRAFERRWLERLMRAADWSVTLAAQLGRTDRKNLYKKLRSHGLERPDSPRGRAPRRPPPPPGPAGGRSDGTVPPSPSP